MDAASQKDQDRIVPAGEATTELDNFPEQRLSPKDERIVSANPSPGSAIIGHSWDVKERPSNAGGNLSIVPPHNAYGSHEQTAPYGGYGGNTGDGYSQYFTAAESLHVSPIIYNDNPSLVFHSGYGFNPEMPYGQYSPVATPLPSIMVEGQLYSPHQIPFSPFFYPQPAPANVPPSLPVSLPELLTSESTTENFPFSPGSGYLIDFGSCGGGNMSGAPGSSPLTSPAAYLRPMGILGPYEHHVGQKPLHGYGLTSASSIGHYQHGGSYQGSNLGSGSVSYSGTNDHVRLALDKGRRRERDRDSFYAPNDSLSFDRNRGPRASMLKGKSTSEQSSSSGNVKEVSSDSGLQHDLYNRPDFFTDYKNAKFLIMKSFSEDNVHKSIKYSVWASTPHGNKKLNAVYHEAKGLGNCPVFLLFSVNASGQFCGVAEMIGPVDFEKDADYWQQDRWSGQFPVKWHIIKDVPNSRFRHILLENNDNKPVTHSRDSQEVKLEQGIEMLNIFTDHNTRASILDDFDFYDQRERVWKDWKAKQEAMSTTDAPGLLADRTINQMSDRLGRALQLHAGSNKAAAASEIGAISRNDHPVSPANDSNVNVNVHLANDSDNVDSYTKDSVNDIG